MTETGMSLGTPHYMSPEQATADKDLTNRSDIYSLGAVLYEMLTGDPPHTASSAQAIVMKILADAVRPVNELRKSVPPNVAAAVAKALEKLAADRFDTASAFAGALTNPDFTMPSTAAAARGAQLSPRGRRPLALLAVTAALLGGAALWGWLRPRPDVSKQVLRHRMTLPAIRRSRLLRWDPHHRASTAVTESAWYRSRRTRTRRWSPQTSSPGSSPARRPRSSGCPDRPPASSRPCSTP